MNFFAVIDTNVLVSAALKWDSVPGTIIDLAFNGVIVPLVNEEIIKEYHEVLCRPKFHLTEDIVKDIIDEIREHAVFIAEERLELEFADPKDQVFYEVLIEKRKKDSAYLITGNIKHFPEKEFVVTPREMLEIILKNSENLFE